MEGGRARRLRLPARYAFAAWGPAQVLRWSNPLEDERVLVRALLTERRGRGRPGNLVLTNRRIVWISGALRPTAVDVPVGALLDVLIDSDADLPIVVRYTGPEGKPEELRLRTYSWWEAVAGSAVGAGASGAAAAAVGTAVAIGADQVASKTQQKNAQVVAALRAGLGLRPEAGSQALPQNIGGLTWKSLLGLPGCGVVALLATMGLAAAIAFHDSEVRHAVPYRAAPMCQSPTQTSCIGTKPATVQAQGSGRHSDGSPGSRTWLLLRLADGSQTYVDLYDPVAGGVSVGEAVSVKVWNGDVTEVDVRGRAAATFRNPAARADDSGWAIVVAALFLALGAGCSSMTLLLMWRQSQIPWALLA